jgi:putative membrane protein
MTRAAALAATLLLVLPHAAWGHGVRAEPGVWWRPWNWDPLILCSLCLLGMFYGRGLTRLWGSVGFGRRVSPWQGTAFCGALLVLFLALLSPLDAISEQLSAAHMVQHMLLMVVAAPLFVVGAPTLVLAWGLSEKRYCLPTAFRLVQARLLWQPLFVWGLYAAVLWGWHHPMLYQAALRDPLVHDAQHLSFFGAACLFWRVVLDPLGRRRTTPPAVVPYLFATALHASALGVFLALSPRPWYGDYASQTAAWGFAPLEDQQLAGLIMWMPSCLVYPALAAALFGSWLASQTQADGKRELTGYCSTATGG